MPTCLLTHTGRKTGRTRQTPLLFVEDGEALIVAGSNWRARRASERPQHDPAWALNLIDDPQAVVQVGKRHWSVVARVTEGEEREQLWKRLLQVWPAYDT